MRIFLVLAFQQQQEESSSSFLFRLVLHYWLVFFVGWLSVLRIVLCVSDVLEFSHLVHGIRITKSAGACNGVLAGLRPGAGWGGYLCRGNTYVHKEAVLSAAYSAAAYLSAIHVPINNLSG